MRLFIRRDDEIRGPYLVENVSHFILSGSLSSTDLIGASGKGPWLLVGDVKGDFTSETELSDELQQRFGEYGTSKSYDDFSVINIPKRVRDLTQFLRPFFAKLLDKDQPKMGPVNIGYIAIAAMIVLCCGLFGAVVDTDEMTESMAEVEAVLYVRNQLKSPTTAEFSNIDSWKMSSSTSELVSVKWEVTGTVDSQNGFGAMIRSRWSVIVHDMPDGQVRFTDFTIE